MGKKAVIFLKCQEVAETFLANQKHSLVYLSLNLPIYLVRNLVTIQFKCLYYIINIFIYVIKKGIVKQRHSDRPHTHWFTEYGGMIWSRFVERNDNRPEDGF